MGANSLKDGLHKHTFHEDGLQAVGRVFGMFGLGNYFTKNVHGKIGIIEGLMAMAHAMTATAYGRWLLLVAMIRVWAGVIANVIPSSTGAAKL